MYCIEDKNVAREIFEMWQDLIAAAGGSGWPWEKAPMIFGSGAPKRRAQAAFCSLGNLKRHQDISLSVLSWEFYHLAENSLSFPPGLPSPSDLFSPPPPYS